jgi:hypothetical protein
MFTHGFDAPAIYPRMRIVDAPRCLGKLVQRLFVVEPVYFGYLLRELDELAIDLDWHRVMVAILLGIVNLSRSSVVS